MTQFSSTASGGTDVNQSQQTTAEWVRQYGDDLYTWACHKISDDVLAEDLVQDTFLSAIQSFSTFKGNSNVKTWLFSILNNKIIDHYRQSARSSLRLEDPQEIQSLALMNSIFNRDGEWVDTGVHPHWTNETNLLDDPDFDKVMSTCLDELPPNWKTMVVAKYLLEKESQEICQELKITPSNYWQVLHRAKLMLKKCIELQWFNK